MRAPGTRSIPVNDASHVGGARSPDCLAPLAALAPVFLSFAVLFRFLLPAALGSTVVTRFFATMAALTPRAVLPGSGYRWFTAPSFPASCHHPPHARPGRFLCGRSFSFRTLPISTASGLRLSLAGSSAHQAVSCSSLSYGLPFRSPLLPTRCCHRAVTVRYDAVRPASNRTSTCLLSTPPSRTSGGNHAPEMATGSDTGLCPLRRKAVARDRANS
jgi:hypothetical protein